MEVVPNQYVVSNSVNVLDLNINTCTVTDTEKLAKKLKKNWSLEAVLGEDVTQPVPLIPVLTVPVNDKKATSNLVK